MIPAFVLAAIAGAAWGQAIVVRHVDTPAEECAAGQASQVSVAAKGANQSSVDCKSTGKRIQLIVEARVDTEAWEARLTDNDIDARELAFNELVARARKDTSLGLAIQSWSTDSDKPELAWSARMALRELRNQSRPMSLAWVPRVRSDQSVTLEAHAGLEEPGAEESNLTPIPERLRTLVPDGALPLSDRQMLSLSAPRAFEIPQHAPQHQLQLRLEYQPEGITLVVAEFHNGQVRKRKYAAGSLDALLEDHPELRTQIPGLENIPSQSMAMRSGGLQGMGFLRQGANAQGRNGHVHADEGVPALTPRGQWVRQGAGQSGGMFRFAKPGGAPSNDPPTNAGPSKHILGVKVTSLPLSDAEHRLLGPGVGLLIERREPGSIAEALELQRGDILVELLGQQLCSAEEITRLLRENTRGEVTVKFVDRDGIERVRTWKPAPAPKR